MYSGYENTIILGASVSTHKLGFTYENSIFGFWLGEAVLLKYSIYRCNEAQLEYIPYQVCDSVYHTPTVCFCWCSHLLTHRHNASPPSQHRFYSYYSNSGYTTQVAIILKPSATTRVITRCTVYGGVLVQYTTPLEVMPDNL